MTFTFSSGGNLHFFLDSIIEDNRGGLVTFSNPKSSNEDAVTVTLNGAYLRAEFVSEGFSEVSFDYTDSQGNTGKFIFNLNSI